MSSIPIPVGVKVAPRTRRSRRGPADRRLAVWLAVAAAHASALFLLSLKVPPAPPEGGAAPVINLTLTPRPRFDSETPTATASSADRPSEAGALATPVRSPLQLHEAPRVFAPDLTVAPPTTPVPAEPTPVVRDANAQTGAAPGTGRRREPGTADAVAGATRGGGGRALGAAAAPDTDAHAVEVIAWIERHKRHPGGARGVVTVGFQLDRRGRVHRLRLVRSSGVRGLDRSALDQITTTQPFPRPASGARWSRRDFTVNIDYRAR